MRRLIPTLAIIALALTGCASKAGTITTTEQVTGQSFEEPRAKQKLAKESASTNPTFGDTYTWPNGLAVTISEPEPLTLTNELTADLYNLDAGDLLAFTVTIHNGTSEDVEAFAIITQMTSGSRESEAVFATEDNIDMPTSTILPGKDLIWKVAYVVADPTDMQLTVNNMVDLDSAKVHFTN